MLKYDAYHQRSIYCNTLKSNVVSSCGVCYCILVWNLRLVGWMMHREIAKIPFVRVKFYEEIHTYIRFKISLVAQLLFSFWLIFLNIILCICAWNVELLSNYVLAIRQKNQELLSFLCHLHRGHVWRFLLIDVFINFIDKGNKFGKLEFMSTSVIFFSFFLQLWELEFEKLEV